MKHTRMRTIAALALAAPVAAQGVTVAQPAQVQAALEKQVVETARVAVESRVTSGAPYAADSVTESVQVLERRQSHRAQDRDAYLSRQRRPHAA